MDDGDDCTINNNVNILNTFCTSTKFLMGLLGKGPTLCPSGSNSIERTIGIENANSLGPPKMQNLCASHLLLAFLYLLWAFIGTSTWRWPPDTPGPRVMCVFVSGQPIILSLAPSMAPCSIHLRPKSWRTGEHLGWDCPHVGKYMGLLKFVSLTNLKELLAHPDERWKQTVTKNYLALMGSTFCTPGERERGEQVGFLKI